MAFIGNTNTTQAFTPAVDFFSGNASTTAFTLSRPVASVAQVQAVISNVPQDPGSAYTVSGSTITFTSAPPSGTNNIYVSYTSPITQVIAPGQGTVTTTSLASSTGTGAVVLATSPTLVTPILGAASATSITVAAGAVGTPSITTAGDTNTGIFFPAADTIAFSEGGAEAMRIDSSGNVGIGTTAPAQKLHVASAASAGNVYLLIDSSGTANGYNAANLYKNDQRQFRVGCLGGVGGFTNGALVVYDETAAAFRMVIDQSGNLLVGKTTSISGGRVTIKSATTQHLGEWQVGTDGYGNLMYNAAGTNVGAINIASASTSYVTTSDYRLKEDVIPMIGALAKVAQLKPVTYKWKADGSNSQGFIAHELQEIVSECVVGEKDAVNEDGSIKPQGIDTSFLVATLTAAIQEQQALITALTARITALENT